MKKGKQERKCKGRKICSHETTAMEMKPMIKQDKELKMRNDEK